MNTDYFMQENNMETEKTENVFGISEEVTMLDETGLGRFTGALSGRNENGESKVQVSYQSYALEEPEDSPDKTRIYTVSNAACELSIDKKNPGFFVLDIIFQSYNDPELKLLWARLQRHKANIAKDPAKTWIFYINLLEKASVSVRTEERDVLVMGNVFNPLIYYLTREVPNQVIEEDQERRITEKDELTGTRKTVDIQGGNIIRMLIADNLVQFQIRSDVDTQEIKGEVEREQEENRYVNSQGQGGYFGGID
jgi:hypothetical protein